MNRTTVEAKVDLKDQWIIVRKTVVRETSGRRDVQVFGLTEDGYWQFIPEGSRYPDRCLLTIYGQRDEVEELDLWAMPDGAVKALIGTGSNGATNMTAQDLDSHRGFWFWTLPWKLMFDKGGRPWLHQTAPLSLARNGTSTMRVAIDHYGNLMVDTSSSDHEGWTTDKSVDNCLRVHNWKV